jgi:carboxylate-amine ligase
VEPFGSAAGYSAAVEDLIASGAAMDRGMLYFDARPAVSYPTLEIRVADVCTEIEDAVVVAVLARGLVETAARSWRAAEPMGTWRTELLRAATWRAGRDGLSGELIDPSTRRPAPAATVVKSLLAHVREAVDEAGETDALGELIDQVLSRGTGATRQRGVFDASGSIRAVVEDLRVRTAESCDRPPG